MFLLLLLLLLPYDEPKEIDNRRYMENGPCGISYNELTPPA